MFYGEHNRCISHLSGPFTLAVLLDVEIQSSPDRKRSPRRTNKFPLIRKERNKIIFRISMLEGKLSCLHKHSIFLNCFLFWNKVLGGIGPLALCLPIYEMREGPPNVTHWRRAAYDVRSCLLFWVSPRVADWFPRCCGVGDGFRARDWGTSTW